MNADSAVDRGYLVTLTAPGVDQMPWDESQCLHGPGVACAGDVGCVVEAQALARWHWSIAQRWSWWVTEVRRRLPAGCDVQFCKTYEPQLRGALHIHAMVRVTGAVTVRSFSAAAKWSARTWGFGRQCDVQVINLGDQMADGGRQVARSAGYVAKYVTKNCEALPLVRRVDESTGEIRHGGLRPWSASRSWGDTMRAIQARRSAWAAAHATAGPGGAEGDALDLNDEHYAELLRRFGFVIENGSVGSADPG